MTHQPGPRTYASPGSSVQTRAVPWDALALGVPVIELIELAGDEPAALDAVLAAVDATCATEAVGVATTRIVACADAAVAALARAGYRHVETSHALRLAPVVIARGLDRGLSIEPATTADAPALAALALAAFTHSRYLEDDRIHPARARARMARWIIDSLGNGDDVVVARRRGALAAAMSWRRVGDSVRLLLGGTAQDAGPIAPLFWTAVVRELAGRGVRAIHTRVSTANPAALRLHHALGFVAGEPELGMTKLYPVGEPIVGSPPRDVERTT